VGYINFAIFNYSNFDVIGNLILNMKVELELANHASFSMRGYRVRNSRNFYTPPIFSAPNTGMAALRAGLQVNIVERNILLRLLLVTSASD